VAIADGGTAMADVPRVAVDIAPVHSLVARVMEGVGTPDLIVPPGASPHEYSLRPSEAAALQEADIVVWMGEDLTPWMEDAVETLAEDAAVTTLPGGRWHDAARLPRGRAVRGAYARHDDHDHGHHDDHDHDDDHDDDHEDHADHDHDHDHEEHAMTTMTITPMTMITGTTMARMIRTPGSRPQRRRWLNLIAAELSAADPDNAGAYFANAAAARAKRWNAVCRGERILDPVRGGSFIVFHDAYQYFETDFDFPASGAISLSDASDPSPARIAEIRAACAREGIDCVLAEPQFNEGLVATVLDGTDAAIPA
jgi:zinc transport system substrate-binding protein